MKLKFLGLILSVGLFAFSSCNNANETDTDTKTDKKTEKSVEQDISIPENISLSTENDSIDYSWGINIGNYLKNQGYIGINMKALAHSFLDSYNSKQLLLDEQQAQTYLQTYTKALQDEKNNPGSAKIDKTTHSNSTNLNNELDTISYCWGINLGSFFRKQGYDDINISYILKSLDDVLNAKTLLVDAQTANMILQKASEKTRQQKLVKNKEASEAFLAENKTKPGITSLESGLQYKIVKEGTGAIPKVGEKINAHYHGTLTDGTVFDSSVEKGQPFSFTLGQGQVIKGWDEAFQLMPVGSKWIIYLPSDIAYGENPRPGGPIEPNMALIFEVELLSIEK
ncbi:MAG: FKBP-type peptidyl-prolyl cis-trans isomerase [Bacteroidetes bacterium]|jgi:FKBP-type peptidyl-prolyl cis-trans isomerase FklB|nr:FKBP-type peptidyl-prolyl cis-trans isomerase [Bacteroidota bacterium]MBT6685325.1 FKBP-type peptidyl-prolyl cis-trans isomerase [Bacteroidota bacterium]MBT7142883.1 FKBP-type peptidyl-prolyl cis-trans isomerase [Bacteroidota bacterium]MBT7490364.1 FKBP-type peptidyl-prolyl cis-trans isomerase [Bacteroidota bacterium]